MFFGGKGDEVHLQVEGRAARLGPELGRGPGRRRVPERYYFYLPRICNHCTHPACLEACPRQAIEKREEDGIVLINEDRCRGYRFCMEACPYKKIYFNHARKVAQKCIFCFPRIEQGVANACARQCPGRVRFVGYRDDQNGPIYKLVDKWKVAMPLHPEYGTEPNVFYVPPLAPPRFDENGDIDESKPRIPNEYLVSLFGPRVLEVARDAQGGDGEDAGRAEVRADGHADRLQVEGHVRRLRPRPGHASSGRRAECRVRTSTGASFLRASAAGRRLRALALGLLRLRGGGAAPPAALGGAAAAAGAVAYGDWRDVYRERWAWDKVVRSSHWVNCWYQAHCAWNVYVKDGIVWREEQAADYPQITPGRAGLQPARLPEGRAASASACTTPRASSTR